MCCRRKMEKKFAFLFGMSENVFTFFLSFCCRRRISFCRIISLVSGKCKKMHNFYVILCISIIVWNYCWFKKIRQLALDKLLENNQEDLSNRFVTIFEDWKKKKKSWMKISLYLMNLIKITFEHINCWSFAWIVVTNFVL